MSLAHGDPLRRPIPHGGYESRWLSPECRLVGSDPHKHVRMSIMASSRMSSHKHQVLMSNNMECIECPKGLSLCHHVSNMEYIADVNEHAGEVGSAIRRVVIKILKKQRFSFVSAWRAEATS
uniref:Uncharacterized protein n=1 Tax=Ananas comosus var. bracteatus TaxID=296719 RepID=A0A6V7Q5T1_ANACO|nr:unnamed protein product [Ananas comosus var. bracteatus]